MFIAGEFNAVEKFYRCFVRRRWGSYCALLEVFPVFKSRRCFKSKVLLGRTVSSLSNQLSVVTKGTYHLVWNRSVKRKTGLGGNIPIDLVVEHYIHIVKLLKRKLGPNQNNKQTLRRYMKALGFTKVSLEDFDESTCIIQQSGRHTKKSSAKDKAKIVDELVKARAVVCQPNRKYNVFKNFKPSLLADFD